MKNTLDFSAIHRGELIKRELRGGGGGPSIVITAGIHGNEQTGVYAAMMVEELLKNETLLGDVAVMPVCNPSAFLAHAREAPEDGADLNRLFPGTGDGFSQQLAARIYRMTAGYDYMIDLHCCGIFGSTYVMSGYTRLAFQIDMARDLGISPLCHTNGSQSAGQLYLAAGYERGQKGLLIELPGGQPGGVIFKKDALHCAKRIIAFMKKRGIVEGIADQGDAVDICGIQLRHTAPGAGLFIPSTENGAHVRPEDAVGTFDGAPIKAGCDGFVTYTASYMYASEGARLVNIAPIGQIDGLD